MSEIILAGDVAFWRFVGHKLGLSSQEVYLSSLRRFFGVRIFTPYFE
tara:strand:- start:210 stop:350 length:141 start_codon:yes stop_codon:yes gene_type:complete